MDRVESYKLLTEEMKKLAAQVHQDFSDLDGTSVEVDVLGGSGTRYHVGLIIQQISDERFAILGNIRDNNSYKFSLLEERWEFDSRDDF